MATKSERDDRPRTKKKKKQPSRAGLWIGLSIGGGVLVFVIAIAVVIIVVAPWNQAGANKKVDHAQENQNPPPGKLGGEVVKNPKSLLGNARRRADETARNAEMDGILTLYVAYCDDVKNVNSRSLDSFLAANRTAPSQTINKIKSKEYTLNLRAKLGSEDVVVYETEEYDDKTYFCYRANRQSGYLSPQDLRAALGQ